MVKSYLLCIGEKFNTNGFYVPVQNTLFENEVEGEAITYIKKHKNNFHLTYNQYKCHHDYRHNKTGRVFQKDFSYYFEPLDFYLYKSFTNKLTLIQAKTEVAVDFINKLNITGEYTINPIEINFEKMIPKITEIGGAWFANLKKAHLKSAGYFGPNVNKSEEYKAATKEGNISSIQINYVNRVTSNEHIILISKKGTIVLYDGFETIEEELDLVTQIYDSLIKPHVSI